MSMVAPVVCRERPEAKKVDVGSIVRFSDAITARKLLETGTGTGAAAGGFSVVEHLIGPKELVGPLHKHSREDEFTVVIKGRIGFLLGEEVFEAGPGELVRKLRNQWHTFWSAGEEPAVVLEVISPSGFGNYFQEIGPYFPDGAPPDLKGMASANEKYGQQMDFGSEPQLITRFGLARPLEMGAEPPR